MNIDELKVKHENYNTDYPAKHTHISIEFAISVLEESLNRIIDVDSDEAYYIQNTLEDKIQEHKTYLDDNR